MSDEAIREARAAVSAASKQCTAANRALKKAERALDKAQGHLDRLVYDREVAKRTKADLAGRNGPLFTLTSTAESLFEQPQTVQFVLTQGEFVLGNRTTGNGSRFRARRVGSIYDSGIILDVYPQTKSITVHERHDGERIVFQLDRDQIAQILTVACNFKGKDRRGISLWANMALSDLRKAA